MKHSILKLCKQIILVLEHNGPKGHSILLHGEHFFLVVSETRHPKLHAWLRTDTGINFINTLERYGPTSEFLRPLRMIDHMPINVCAALFSALHTGDQTWIDRVELNFPAEDYKP
jgi:hypothetical protein